ncbi:antibiotic biosynthesis monooxygenase family protein [Asanoa iriomotensis]|uniref:Antibiotic biosynthesis monooxygenase n=1 Tax=Asanoa iriomotensis TaxID=234613 RepID=A0ABQ4C0X9_9ACTN|nr:antibiotic biosynthesis monooxygenase [Asanoa iriomotensis]GIF56431.1 antibiotic biosynthesis monooxygenase [Asanoa iriomotensis]
MSARVRVLLYAVAPDGEAVTATYHRVSTELAGTAGLLGNELLRSVYEPERFIVISEWESLDAFRAWERGSAHRATTAPLRDFHDTSRGSAFGLYEVTAAYRGDDVPLQRSSST